MSDSSEKKAGWKQKIVHEMIEYYINFVYLFVFFGMFTLYRRLILAKYQIVYLHYGVALVEALVLAKVIMIGQVLHLDRGLEDKPLIVTTLFRTVLFTVWVAAFSIFEHVGGGLLNGEGLAGIIDGLWSDRYELLARCLVTFLAFIPFFAFKELGRVVGQDKIRALYFSKGSAIRSVLSKIKEDR